MPKISVIIPVYNVEKYLEKCLLSVISQTFEDIEIICVNDGSTDNSRNILAEYQKKDSRIKIVDKENGGLSSARNAGMEVAVGEFYSFVDSDDWIEATMLEKLYKNITTLNTDISICAVTLYDDTLQVFNKDDKYFSLNFFDKTFDNRVFSYKDTIPFIMDVCVMAWNKLYRKSFIDECNAKFPDGLIFEDGPFFFSIYFKTEKVSIVRDALYYYRINREGSIVQKPNKQFLDILEVVELMYNSIKDLPCFDDIKFNFYHKKADDIVYRYELSNIENKRLFSKRIKSKTFLFDENVFDFKLIRDEIPYTYKNLTEMQYKTNIFRSYLRKWEIRFKYKIMQVLYTEPNIYYFKFWNLKFRLKKRVNLYDIWYSDDKIHGILFNKIKFHINFEYSKLEKR